MDKLDRNLSDLAKDFKAVNLQLKSVVKEVTTLTDSNNFLGKRMLEKTVVFSGVPDQAEEAVEVTCGTVKEISKKLDLNEG